MSKTARLTDAVEDGIATRHAHGLDPVDVSVIGYLVASALLVLVREPGAGNFVPLAVRAAFFVIFVALRRRPLPEGRLWEVARRAYPIALFPYFYAELATLNQLVTHERFDPIVIGWEQALFGSQPSIQLREWLPWWPLSEYLHLGYFSYYFVPLFTIVTLAVKGRMKAISETMMAIMLVFVACYAFFIAFPVVGPYHTYIPPDPNSLGHVFPRITHAIVRAGSSPGTAFPSSHVAVSMTAFLQAFRYDRRAGWILVAFVPALVVGTVYGGFHYAVDAAAGAVLAVVVTLLSRALFRRLEEWRARASGETLRDGTFTA